MVAAAVVPFSSIGPAHAVDADTATTFNEHMGVFDDENAVASGGREGRAAAASKASKPPLEPMTRASFARAVEAKGGKVTKSPKSGSKKSWPTPLVVVPAVFDEWDTPVITSGSPKETKTKTSAVPDWAAPGEQSAYSVSELYQRRDEDAPGFVPNRAYETGVFLKFVVDHYDDLPEVTAFVSGDFTKDAGGDANARAALESVADAVAVAKLGKKTTVSGKTSGKTRVSRKAFAKDKDASDGVPTAIAQYQPLVVDPETFLQSRSPGELVQMWKEQRWGWEDIMGDSSGAAAAHLSRCWRAVAESFGADLERDDVKKTSTGSSKHDGSKTKTTASRLGASFFFASSSAASRTVAEQGEAKDTEDAAESAASVSAADRDELAKPPVSVSLYPGAHFAVTRDALLRLPKKTWERAYEQLVEKGACVDDADASDAPRDEIRDKFDLGVSLEFLSHVVFGGAALDAGAEARCCGAACVLQDPSCAELGDLRKEPDADAYDVASIGGPRFDLDAKRMLSVERVISRYNGWNLKELREERLAAEVAAVGEDEAAVTDDDVDPVDDDDVPEDPRLTKAAPGMDVDVDPADVEAALEADDAALEAADAELEAALDEEDEASELDEDAELGTVAYVTADLGASNQFVPEDWDDARETLHNAEAKWQHLIDAEKTKNKVGTLGGSETTDGAAAAVVADDSAKPADDSAKPAESTSETEVENANDGSAVTDAEATDPELKQLLAEYVEQADAQIAEISDLREENARLRDAADAARDDVVDLGADEASRSLAARASAMDKQTLVAMAKQKIDEEETANAKLKEALAAMEEVHHEERAEYGRRVAVVRAAKRDSEAKHASAVEATASLQKELNAEKARAEKTRTDAEAALEHDERRVANLHAKLRDAAKLEQEMEEKKNVAADAARRLRQKLAEADRANAAEETDAESNAESNAEPKPRAKKPIAKVGAAEEGVAALALPPRRRPATAAESQ